MTSPKVAAALENPETARKVVQKGLKDIVYPANPALYKTSRISDDSKQQTQGSAFFGKRPSRTNGMNSTTTSAFAV